MSLSPATAEPAPAAGARRLDGWKQVAAHFGKGVRTAQRWEKENGLPVHRIGREGGEIVFAFAEELDAWARARAGGERLERPATGGAQRAPARVPARPALAVAAAVLLALGVVARPALRAGSSAFAAREAGHSEPLRVQVAGGRLAVEGEDGRSLFTRGPRDGWSPQRAFLTRRGETASVWLVSGRAGNPLKRLEELGPDGSLRQSADLRGPVGAVAEWPRGARALLAVGGADPERGAPSLFVFERDALANGAREQLVFPRLCLAVPGETPLVAEVWADAGGGLTVAALQRREPPGTRASIHDLLVHYLFGPDLSLRRVEVSRQYQVAHARLTRRGLIDHEYGPSDDARLFPVLRVTADGRVRELGPAPVGH